MRTNFDKNIARLHFQRADMVKMHDEQLNEDAEAKIAKRNNELNESAYLSIGSDIHTKRMRQQNAERAMLYEDHFVVLALTEALTKCTEDALLLNLDEYSKLNPNYLSEIHDTIKNFLENANINEDIKNKDIISLYEEILKEVPPADLYLTEEDEKMIVRQNILSKDAIKRNLDTLCRDVRVRAANIVTKDQEAMKAQSDDLETIDNKELEAAPIVAPVQDMDNEMGTSDEVLADPEVEENSEQDMVDPVVSPEVVNSEDDEVVTESVKFKIVHEEHKQGILETLAINEANKMLSEGKEYDSVLALANALKYITILETLDASGLVKIGETGYRNILAASGVTNPTPKHEVEKVETPVEKLPETKKEENIRTKISEIVRSSMPTELMVGQDINYTVFKPYSEWKKEHMASDIQVFDTPSKPIVEEVDLTGKYTNMKGEVFTEEQLVEFFENQGFAVELMDFENLWRSWNFKKH